MFLTLVSLCFYTLAAAVTKGEINDCPRGWANFDKGDACFLILQKRAKWSDAEKACQRHDAHLASIIDEYENSFVFEYVKNANLTTPTVWLGRLSKTTLNGVFQWHDGLKSQLVEGFKEGPPSSSEVCMTLWSDSGSPVGSWHEWDCAYAAGYSALCRRNKKKNARKEATIPSNLQSYIARPCCVQSGCAQRCTRNERCIPNDMDCMWKKCEDGGRGWCLPYV